MALTLYAQAPGRDGVAQTLSRIAGFVYGAMTDGNIRDQSAYAISGCDKGNTLCKCAALLSWVNRTMQYVPDPAAHELSYEMVHDPRLIAKAIANKKRVYGDCDDMAGYLSALLASCGLKPTLRAVGYHHGPLSHVYVICEGQKLDPTRDAWTISYQAHQETDALELRV